MRRCNYWDTIAVPVFLLLLVSSVTWISPARQHSVPSANSHNKWNPSDLVSHDAVVIMSNSDFSIQGWPGDGTEVNPYRIEDLNITIDSTGITISNTTCYFRISNCFLASNSCQIGYGVLLTNTTNGALDLLDINEKFVGVEIQNSSDIIIHQSEIYNNDVECVSIRDSENCTVTSCYLSNSSHGVLLDNAHNCIVDNCTIEYQYGGILCENSVNCTFIGNNIDLSAFGIEVSHSEKTVVSTNALTNTYSGLLILFTTNDLVLDNNCSFNENGIIVGYSNSCIVRNNTFAKNEEVGLLIRDCLYTEVYNNSLVDNGLKLEGEYVDHWQLVEANNTRNGLPWGYFWQLNHTVIDGSQYKKIILANCTNVTVQGGNLTGNFIGMQMAFSHGCSVSGSIVADNYWLGVFLEYCEDCSIFNCTIYDSQKATMIEECVNCSIVDCIAYDTVYLSGPNWNCSIRNNTLPSAGITSYGGNRSVFQYNSLSSGGYYFQNEFGSIVEYNEVFNSSDNGIDTLSVYDCVFRHNSISSSRIDGIRFYSTRDCVIHNNLIHSNRRHGIYLVEGSNCILTNNYVHSNTGFGILMRGSGHQVENNNISWNVGGNALDNGTRNQWDRNSWSDYNGTGAYLIPGSAGSSENHPNPASGTTTSETTTTYPNGIPDHIFIPAIAVSVVLIVVTIVVFEKRVKK